MDSNQKGVAHVFILIFILASLLAVYFFWQNSSLKAQLTEVTFTENTSERPINPASVPETNINWKTFVNQKHQYQVQYPEEWKIMTTFEDNPGECVIDEVFSENEIIVLSAIELADCGFKGESLPSENAEIAIQVSDNPWANLEEILEPPFEYYNIAGQKGVLYRYSYHQSRPNINATRIYFNYNNKGFLVFIKNQTEDGSEYNPINDQILSTFEFLENDDMIESTENTNSQ